jgi:hypothetical protein
MEESILNRRRASNIRSAVPIRAALKIRRREGHRAKLPTVFVDPRRTLGLGPIRIKSFGRGITATAMRVVSLPRLLKARRGGLVVL